MEYKIFFNDYPYFIVIMTRLIIKFVRIKGKYHSFNLLNFKKKEEITDRILGSMSQVDVLRHKIKEL